MEQQAEEQRPPLGILEMVRKFADAHAKLNEAEPPTRVEQIVIDIAYRSGRIAGSGYSWAWLIGANIREGFRDRRDE